MNILHGDGHVKWNPAARFRDGDLADYIVSVVYYENRYFCPDHTAGRASDMKTFRNPDSVHPPIAAYSHQVEIAQPARWLMLSGQLGRSHDGYVPEDPIRQLEVAFANIAYNLEAAQMNLGDLVKLTIYLVGEFDVAARRAVIKTFLGEHRPCVTMLFIAGLADPAYKVEIEAVACQ